MNWIPRMPKVEWPELILHIPSMVVYWSVYIVGLWWILSFGHGFVIQMFENIPDVQITFGIIAAVAVFMALLVIYSQFVSNKKDELVKKKEAKITGEVYDEVNGKISQKMFWGYPVIAIIAAVVLSAIVLLVINEVADSKYADFVSTPARMALVGVAAELILFAIVDRFFLRSAMDGLFFERVEKPATETFLNGDVIDVIEGTVEKVKTAQEKLDAYLAAGFTEDEALAKMKKQ